MEIARESVPEKQAFRLPDSVAQKNMIEACLPTESELSINLFR